LTVYFQLKEASSEANILSRKWKPDGRKLLNQR